MSQGNGTKAFRTTSFLKKGHGKGPDTRHPFQFCFVNSFPVPQKPHNLFAPHCPKALMYPERNSKDRIRKVLG